MTDMNAALDLLLLESSREDLMLNAGDWSNSIYFQSLNDEPKSLIRDGGNPRKIQQILLSEAARSLNAWLNLTNAYRSSRKTF